MFLFKQKSTPLFDSLFNNNSLCTAVRWANKLPCLFNGAVLAKRWPKHSAVLWKRNPKSLANFDKACWWRFGSGFDTVASIWMSGLVRRGVTRGIKGETIPRAPNHRGEPKNPNNVPSILSLLQYICSRKTLWSNMGAQNLLLALGAILPWYAPACTTHNLRSTPLLSSHPVGTGRVLQQQSHLRLDRGATSRHHRHLGRGVPATRRRDRPDLPQEARRDRRRARPLRDVSSSPDVTAHGREHAGDRSDLIRQHVFGRLLRRMGFEKTKAWTGSKLFATRTYKEPMNHAVRFNAQLTAETEDPWFWGVLLQAHSHGGAFKGSPVPSFFLCQEKLLQTYNKTETLTTLKLFTPKP